jgi:hypothetical protein
LQISPIDPTLKLCSTCVRYQRQSLFNKIEEIENKNSSNEENEKSKEEAKASLTTSAKNKNDISMDSPFVVKKKKAIYEVGEKNTYSKNKNLNIPSSSNISLPFIKKRKHKQNSLHKNKQKLLPPSSSILPSNVSKKRKLDFSCGFGKKKKKLNLSSIFEPKKKNLKKEGPLLKSKYHGVFWNRTSKTWMGKYSCNGKTYHVTSGKNEKKVAKEVRKAARVAKKLGMKPKKPYGKLKEPNPPKVNTNSVQLTSNDIEVIPSALELSPKIPTITKIRSSLPATEGGNSIIDQSNNSTTIPKKKLFSVNKQHVKKKKLSSSAVKAKRKIIYKGVSWSNSRQCWLGQIPHQGNRYYCKASKNACIVAESVRKKAVELRKQGLDIPKGYGTRRVNKNVTKNTDAKCSERKIKKTRKVKAKSNREYYRSSSDSEIESSEQLTSSYDWKELKNHGRKYNAPSKPNELFSITLNWNEVLSGKTLEDGQASSTSSSSDNGGYF